jgi:ribosomal protein S27AE
MAERRKPMICPKCGDLMNHHADKLVDLTDGQPGDDVDGGLGGTIQEMHACPGCGNVESRPGS